MRLVLPEGRAEVLEDCVKIARTLPDYFTAAGVSALQADADCQDLYAEVQGGHVVAFAIVGKKSEFVREILWMAVDRDRQGAGIGSTLLAAVEDELRLTGARILEVKTLASSAEYAPYEKTRRFYDRAGFMLVETIHPYPGWDEDSPCAIYVKAL